VLIESYTVTRMHTYKRFIVIVYRTVITLHSFCILLFSLMIAFGKSTNSPSITHGCFLHYFYKFWFALWPFSLALLSPHSWGQTASSMYCIYLACLRGSILFQEGDSHLFQDGRDGFGCRKEVKSCWDAHAGTETDIEGTYFQSNRTPSCPGYSHMRNLFKNIVYWLSVVAQLSRGQRYKGLWSDAAWAKVQDPIWKIN
jgi:hypothetical protein